MEKLKDCRPRMDLRVMRDIYKKDESFFRLYTSFTPNLKTQGVTGKFYSVHDANDGTVPDPAVMKSIHNRRIGPKAKWSSPCLESHSYGWFNEPLVDPKRNDYRFNRPMCSSEISKFSALMAQNKKLGLY